MELHNNPYVGPRTFTRQDAQLYFGREREAHDLCDLVISERLVLFYAQSGAGKSSLINTRLIPQLQREGFTILPVGRISGVLPMIVKQIDNIFVFNLMLSLDQTQGDPNRFSHMRLSHFFAHLASDDGEHWHYDETAEVNIEQSFPSVLLLDQFEELVTHHLERWPERADFFQQLNQAMLDDPNLWVVLTLREDYIAALEPYAPLMENRLRARFYMQRMGFEAALDAIQRPALAYGRPFLPSVAERLVDNLRRVQVIGNAEDTPITTIPYIGGLGEFIEPVQLQLVCYQLWENLQYRKVGPITQEDLQEAGDIDLALTNFYEQTIAAVLAKTERQVSESRLRNWFSKQLITEAETRGLVYQGNNQTGDVPNSIVEEFKMCFLLHAEVRGGSTWIELVHDRFVAPILRANLRWNKDDDNLGLTYFTTTALDSLSEFDRQFAKLVSNLRPLQALEYNPKTQDILAVTEWLIPWNGSDQLTKLISQRKSNEKLTIRRYDDTYKIAFIKKVQDNDKSTICNELITKKIIDICRQLKPFQALEHESESNIIILITEWLIPSNEIEKVYSVLARRKVDDKVTIRRYDNNYKVSLVSRLTV